MSSPLRFSIYSALTLTSTHNKRFRLMHDVTNNEMELSNQWQIHDGVIVVRIKRETS